LKRSNRLVLLIGIFLAVAAFIGIVVILQGGGGGGSSTPAVATTTKIVVAQADIPLGSKITADMVTTKEVDIPAPANTYGDPSYVIGQTARASVLSGQAITGDTINPSGTGVTTIEVPPGKVAIAVQVDQVSGVGTVIRAGDYIDMVVAITGDKFPVVTLNPTDKSVTVVSGINSTSVKLLLQGGQVLGTLLPPPPAATGNNAQASPGTGSTTTTLNGQQEIVLVAVTAQQAEVVKYAQVDGNISLVLRSGDDFRDPATGLPLDPKLVVPATTTGITLKQLVDNYGVLVPQLVEAILPAK
jgi:pilus assembly protein CpaB